MHSHLRVQPQPVCSDTFASETLHQLQKVAEVGGHRTAGLAWHHSSGQLKTKVWISQDAGLGLLQTQAENREKGKNTLAGLPGFNH